MPSIRSGFGSDFVLKSEKIGIGSETPTNTLDVDGAIKGNLSIAGVATLTSYGGFVAQNQHINKASSIGFATVGVGTLTGYYETETGFTDLGGVHHGDDQYYNTLSEDLVIDEGQILNITNIDMVGFTTIGEYDPHSHQSHVCLGALEELSVIDHFSVPCGGISERVDNPIEGTIRFNDDLNTLEFYNGVEWRQFTYNQGQSGRGVFAGGRDTGGTKYSLIQYINIQSTGNSLNFGNLSNAVESPGACSSSIRGLFGGGRTPTLLSAIDYITIASEGNAISFGSLTQARIVYNATSSSTRGIFFSGYVAPSNVNTIDYVEISTLGNALDFGDVKTLRRGGASFSSPTRAIYAGGYGSPGYRNEIEFLTISTKGDMVDFGDLTNGNSGCNLSCSNTTRGIIGGGANSVSSINSIDYITIATTGNAIDFGSLTVGRRNGLGGVSSSIRGVFAGGYTPTFTNTIDYITLASTGNALDFGDLTSPQILKAGAALSDSHGGLGGF